MFAKPMRDKKYVTMLDPLHIKYGKVLTAVQSVAALLMDVAWVPATLMALGMVRTSPTYSPIFILKVSHRHFKNFYNRHSKTYIAYIEQCQYNCTLYVKCKGNGAVHHTCGVANFFFLF